MKKRWLVLPAFLLVATVLSTHPAIADDQIFKACCYEQITHENCQRLHSCSELNSNEYQTQYYIHQESSNGLCLQTQAKSSLEAFVNLANQCRFLSPQGILLITSKEERAAHVRTMFDYKDVTGHVSGRGYFFPSFVRPMIVSDLEKK